MNKRSAVALAGGVAGALVSGMAAYSIRLQHQPVASEAMPTKPIVKTETRIIKVHKKANAGLGFGRRAQTVLVHGAPTILPASGAPPPVHHTGASRTAGAEYESDDDQGGSDD
jgi:hypothetical protein